MNVAVATALVSHLLVPQPSKPKIHPDRRTAEGDKPSKRKPDKHVVSVHEPVGTRVRLVLAVVHRLLMFHYRPLLAPQSREHAGWRWRGVKR